MSELNPDAGLVAGRGVILISEVAAAPPTLDDLEAYVAANLALESLPSGWAPISDMDPEDLPEFDGEGGDTVLLSTWAFPNVREVADGAPRSVYFVAQALQFDNDTMSHFEGGGTFDQPGIFWAPGQAVPSQAGVIVVFIDKSVGQVVGYHAPRMSIRGDGGITLDAAEWANIPLRFTELTNPGSPGPHAWIGHNFGTPAVP